LPALNSSRKENSPDRAKKLLGKTEYPEAQTLLKIQGVGHITALTFVLTLGNKDASDEVAMLSATSACDRDAVWGT